MFYPLAIACMPMQLLPSARIEREIHVLEFLLNILFMFQVFRPSGSLSLILRVLSSKTLFSSIKRKKSYMGIGKRLMSYGRSRSGSPKEKKSPPSFLASSPRSHGSNPVQSVKRYKNLFPKKSVRSPKATAHPKAEARLAEDAPECSQSRSNPRPRDEIGELTEVFGYFDADGDGKISVVELQGVLRCFGEDPCEEEVRAMIDEVDSDGDGCIDLDDFIRLNTRFTTGFDADSDLREAFRLFDVDNSGCITPKSLHRIMTLLGENSSLDECHRMIKQVDFDGDGVVNFSEFKHMMTTTY